MKNLEKRGELELLLDEIKKSQDAEMAVALTLLKLVTVYPWLMDVAEHGYSQECADQILINEASKLLDKRLGYEDVLP